MTDSNKNWC